MPETHLLYGGGYPGTVTCADGTAVDVSSPWLSFDSEARAQEVTALLKERSDAGEKPAEQIVMHLALDSPEG